MKKDKLTVFFITGILILGLLYFSGNGWISGNNTRIKAQSKLEEGGSSSVKIENKTTSFEVISADIVEQRVHLLLKNNSKKVITAFVCQRGDQKSYIQLSDENFIPPGGTHLEKFRLPSSTTQPFVAVLAIIYEDNKGQGDSIVVQELLDMRLGERIQNERIYEYVQKLHSTPNNKLSLALASTKEAIRNIPEDKDVSDFVKIGLQNAKENALLDLDRLELEIKVKSEIQAKHYIDHLDATYQKKASRK